MSDMIAGKFGNKNEEAKPEVDVEKEQQKKKDKDDLMKLLQ